jgi:hypothetical protein
LVLAACARPGDSGKSAGALTAPRASSSQRAALPAAPSAALAAAPSAAPSAAPAGVAGVRYFRGDDAALAHGWRGMTLSSSEVRMLGAEAVRFVQVTELAVANGRTTFVADFEGRRTRCSLEPEHAAQRFTCFGERLPFTLRELLPPADNAEMALMEQQIKDATPPPGICDQAELCCKAIWPLFVPGEQCDVSFQLGAGRFPQNCRNALNAFRQTSEAKKLPLPAACR